MKKHNANILQSVIIGMIVSLLVATPIRDIPYIYVMLKYVQAVFHNVRKECLVNVNLKGRYILGERKNKRENKK